MKTKDIKFSAYTLTTPLLRVGGGQMVDVFMPNIVRTFFKNLVQQDSSVRRLTFQEEKYAELMQLVDVNGQDVIEGYFNTTIYGEEEEIIDVTSSTVSYVKSKDEGNKNTVYFYLNLPKGLLLIQDDKSNVLTMENLSKYFKSKQFLVKEDIEKFNTAQKDFNLPPETQLMKLKLVSPKDFIGEVSKCSSVKHITLEYPMLSSNEEFVSTISEYAFSNGLNELGKISVKLENSNYGGYLHGSVPFLENVIIKDDIDIAVYGSIDGVSRTIRKNGSNKTLFFHAKDMEILSNGEVKFESLLQTMDTIGRKENLSLGFNPTDQQKINNYTI
ncbi:hypothetical protein ACX1RF_002230 [Listeria monocytogenes]